MGMELHHLHKFTEEILSVMGPWRGLGVILDGKDGKILMPHPFERPVIEVHLCDFDLIGIERVGIDRESMVLGGDHYPTGLEVFDRLIGSPMAKFQFECSSTKGQAQKLVTQADAKDRFLTHQLTDRINRIRNALWVARAIRQEDSIWMVGEDCLCRGRGRQNDHFTVPLPEGTEDVQLYSKV